MYIKKNKSIKTSLGTYHRALETSQHIYYVNFLEGDENGCCIMYDRKMTLVSDNYFAYVGLTEDLTNGTYSWISPKMKENIKYYNDLVDKGQIEGEKYLLK
jgi:hypothetical protein